MAEDQLLSVSELARRFRVHRTTVHAWRKAGCYFLLRNGKWYSTAALCEIHQKTHPPTISKSKNKPSSSPVDLDVMPFEAIAQELGMSMAGVVKVYDRAMKKLRLLCGVTV